MNYFEMKNSFIEKKEITLIHNDAAKYLLEIIRDIRKSKNISQSEIAEKLNLTQRSYSFIENNKRKLDIDLLIELSHKLDFFVKITIDDKREHGVIINRAVEIDESVGKEIIKSYKHFLNIYKESEEIYEFFSDCYSKKHYREKFYSRLETLQDNKVLSELKSIIDEFGGIKNVSADKYLEFWTKTDELFKNVRPFVNYKTFLSLFILNPYVENN